MSTHTRTTAHVASRSLGSYCHAFSLSATCSPRHLRYKALRRPSSLRLAALTLAASRNRSTSHQDTLDSHLQSTWSPDQFVRQALRESPRAPRAEPTHQDASCEAMSTSAPTPNSRNLLLSLCQRLVLRGLLPRVTAEPPTSTPAGHEAAWTVSISLPESDISVKGHGSNIVLAEVAAATQFHLALSSPHVRVKLSSCTQIPLSPIAAQDIIQSYWQFAHASRGALRRTITKLGSGAFEARTFAGATQIGEPVTLALRESAREIQTLGLALAVINGHPDLWPTSTENPFQAKIVLDRARLDKLRHLIAAATAYLDTDTTPVQAVGGRQRGFLHGAAGEGSEQDTVNVQIGRSEGAPHRNVLDLQTWLAALPFPPDRAKMLVLGASIRCLEHSIILAAVENHAVYRKTASHDPKGDGYQHPAARNVMEGDHPGILGLFQRLRNKRWLAKKQSRLPKIEHHQEQSPHLQVNAQSQAKEEVAHGRNVPLSDHEEYQGLPNSSTGPGETYSAKKAAVAKRFDHFDPDAIASVSAAARDIERSMITAGLAPFQKDTTFIDVPMSGLKIRAEPYGGDLSRTAHKRSILRPLLLLGFPENIAQIGHGALAPGQPPPLRIMSQEVYIDSPLKAHMPQKQLYKTLRAGPMMVVTGLTTEPKGNGLHARYCTPISTWEAVLLCKNLSYPEVKGSESPVADAVNVLVNKWLPVLVKSEVDGVSNEQARDTLFEARGALHRAIDKAMYDYVIRSWCSIDFYNLLSDLPNEDSFHAKAVNKRQEGKENEPLRLRPRGSQPARRD